MNIAFKIGEGVFSVDCHDKLFKLMRIKKIREIEAIVEYDDGWWVTKFDTMNDGTIAMCGRIKEIKQ